MAEHIMENPTRTGGLLSRLRHIKLGDVIVYIPVMALAVVTFLPYYWMVIGSLKPVPELRQNPPTFFVEKPSLNNFYDVQRITPPDHQLGIFQRFPETPCTFCQKLAAGLRDPIGIHDVDVKFTKILGLRIRPHFQGHIGLGVRVRLLEEAGGFFRFYVNSIGISTTITVLVLIIGSLAAFVLAKHQFPGRRLFFIFFIASMMVPWQVMLIPGFLLMRDIGKCSEFVSGCAAANSWIDSYWALIIPALPKAFVVFFMVQFMKSIPDELLDAARIDGANEFKIWWRIVIPLIRPALVAMSIFVFLGEWNNFVWPLIIIQSAEKRTLPLALSTIATGLNGATNVGVVMASALLVSLPTLLMFIIFQKQFVRGIAFTGLKG